MAHAQAQPLERLRDAAAAGERQCRHVAPAPRHGAAAVAHPGEMALPALQPAEAAAPQRAQSGTPPAQALAPPLPAACRALGHTLPALWPTAVLAQAPRKAILRGLIAKGVLQRARRDPRHTRSVWRGGATTTLEVPGTVGALTALPTAHAMAHQIRGRCAAGTSDDDMARQLPQPGERSPSPPAVLPSTVQGMRRKRGRMQERSQSPPRRIAGDLTVPQLAQALGIPPPWGYHPSQRGTVVLQRDAPTRRSRCPDRPETLAAFGQWRAGHRRAGRSCAPSRCRRYARWSARAAAPSYRSAALTSGGRRGSGGAPGGDAGACRGRRG
jgi:hypothetical protein